MTEYEECTRGYNLEDFKRELDFQIKKLGYALGDSFPSFLQYHIDRLTA